MAFVEAIGGQILQKHILALTLTGLLTCSGLAQEQGQIEARSWTLTTSLTTGAEERVNCTLVFPTEEGMPQLRISMANQTDPARMTFDLRFAGALAENDRDKVADVSVTIGPRVVAEGLEATWRESNEGRLTFSTQDPGTPLLEAIARSLTISVKASDKAFNYDLTGSRRAIVEMRKCLS